MKTRIGLVLQGQVDGLFKVRPVVAFAPAVFNNPKDPVLKNKLLTALLTSVSLMAGSVAMAQPADHAPATPSPAAEAAPSPATPSPASMGDKAADSMAATPSANAAEARTEPGALSATPATTSKSMEAERVGTTEPGPDEIASEQSRTAKKPVKKSSVKKTVKKAKTGKSTKTSKAVKDVDSTAAAVQLAVPTNLAQ